MALAALTTVFTPPAWCAARYAVELGGGPLEGTSTNPASSGWLDPSFTRCVPAQYTDAYPTFSPGVCPSQMAIVSSGSDVVAAGSTRWTAACCQSGFSTAQLDPRWICTSTVTTPMAFLLDPDIATADVYTTMSNLYILHDQITVLWQESDLPVLPTTVAAQYAAIMGIAVPSGPSSATSQTSEITIPPTPGPSPAPAPRTTPMHSSSTSPGPADGTSASPHPITSQAPSQPPTLQTSTTSATTSRAPRMLARRWTLWTVACLVVLFAGLLL